nr:hypothetical protein [Tanacetum cinerariifolium]
NVVNEANDLMVNNSQPMFDSNLSLDMSRFSPIGSNIWFKLYGPPSDRDVDLIGTVIQSWYVMGRLGAYNSSNLQELADHVVEVNFQNDVLDGMFTFYDSTVSTLQIFQVASVTFDLLLLLGLGSYLITLFSLLMITTKGLDDLIIRCKCANKPGIRMYF